MRNHYGILAYSALLIGGCGLLDTKEKAKKLDQNDLNLSGTWNSDCLPTDSFDLAHTKRVFRFSEVGDFEKSEHFSSKEDCADPSFTYTVTGTYASLGTVKDNDNLKQINFTVEKALVNVKSEDAVTALNTIALCGRSDWKVGEEFNVADKDCANLAHKKGDVIFDVYEVKDKQLSFGQNFVLLSGDEPDDRPDSVQRDLAYTKE